MSVNTNTICLPDVQEVSDGTGSTGRADTGTDLKAPEVAAGPAVTDALIVIVDGDEDTAVTVGTGNQYLPEPPPTPPTTPVAAATVVTTTTTTTTVVTGTDVAVVTAVITANPDHYEPIAPADSGQDCGQDCAPLADTYSPTGSPTSAYHSSPPASSGGDSCATAGADGYDGDCDLNDDGLDDNDDSDATTADEDRVLVIDEEDDNNHVVIVDVVDDKDNDNNDDKRCEVEEEGVEVDDNHSSDSGATQVLNCSDLEDINNNNIVSDSNNNRRKDSESNDKCFKPKWIFVGTTLLSRWTDGLFYMGLVVQIDPRLRQCLIRFEDSSLHWIRFDDLHKQLSADTVMADSDILCAHCRDGRSQAPNEIVICDVCNRGYHQRCHKPRIGDEILEPDVPWTCRLCVFALGTKQGGAERGGTIGRAMKHMKREFPYELEDLHWDAEHQTNAERRYCYCGGDGNYWSKMLTCGTCAQWFHEACIQALETPLLYGDHYYQFKCGVCARPAREQLKRVRIDWPDMLALVINNLALQHQKRFFDLTADILPFVQTYGHVWRMAEDVQKLSELELLERMDAALTGDPIRFVNGREVRKKHSTWALRIPFPFEKPLIFAPPPQHQLSPTPSTPGSSPIAKATAPPPKATSATASPLPLIYGACRKGATKYPVPNKGGAAAVIAAVATASSAQKPITSNNKSVNNRKRPAVVLKTGRSNSCSSSTGSNSCSTASMGSAGGRCPQTASLAAARAAIAKKKARTAQRPNPKLKPLAIECYTSRPLPPPICGKLGAASVAKRVSKYTSFRGRAMNGSEDSCVSEDTDTTVTTPVVESLDAAIPVPKNFDGRNNPFVADVDNALRSRLGTCSPPMSSPTRISCKVEPYSPGSGGGGCSGGSVADPTTPKMECYIGSSGGASGSRTDHPFNILAQRVTPDGKIEYLLEWQN